MSRSILLSLLVFAISLTFRIAGPHDIPPYDDLYHAKRIAFTAAHFPHILAFDPDRGFRGAFCLWPPLYDLAMGAAARAGIDVRWLPPILFSLFAAGVALLFAPALRTSALPSSLTGTPSDGVQHANDHRSLIADHLPASVAGFGIALSPYLIGISRAGAIDHHWVEPMLVLAIAGAVMARRGPALAAALIAALFVQTALLVAAALAFIALFFSHAGAPQLPRRDGTSSQASPTKTVDRAGRAGAIGFPIAAAAVAFYRLTQASPDGTWFLGWPHVAALAAAGLACTLRVLKAPRMLALLAGGACLLPVMPSLVAGGRFFGGDPWLRTIVEFQPMFSDPGAIGTDLANLTGGALFALAGAAAWLRRADRFQHKLNVVILFALAYLLLAISSRRFLVAGIPLFIIAGALATARARSMPAAFVAAALTLAPPLAYDLYSFRQPEPSDDSVLMRQAGAAVRHLPPGRVLAPWTAGHAIDVLGAHAVVVDNFGSMSDEATFVSASQAILAGSEAQLSRWCRAHDVRYVVFMPPSHIAAVAAAIGMPIEPRDTVWWRTMRTTRERFVIREVGQPLARLP